MISGEIFMFNIPKKFLLLKTVDFFDRWIFNYPLQTKVKISI